MEVMLPSAGSCDNTLVTLGIEFLLLPNSISGLLDMLGECLESKAPTRFILVLPKQEKLPAHFMELAILHPSCPLIKTDNNFIPLSCTTTIILGLNKLSMLTDPINWETFKIRLHKLCEGWGQGLVSITNSTNNLFSERSSLPHPPRTLSKQPNYVRLHEPLLINFFDIYSPKKPKKLKFLPPRAADLIGQINRHPPFLGILGILPNQLRTLLKETGHEHREEALLDLSRTLFFAGFRIWTKRQTLAKQYWNNVEQLRKNCISRTKGRKRKNENENKVFESNCTNPFHYLKRHSNLSKQRPTRCPCRNFIPKKLYVSHPITVFIGKFKKNVPNHPDPRTDALDYKFNSLPHDNLFITRADVIRKEHDRSKKRSHKQLTLDLLIKKKHKK
jgi:hypothetical protein